MDERDPLLSEAYRDADHSAPSPELDVAILAAARAALAKPVRRHSTWLNWAVPLSTTAVLVLGISLLFKIQREVPETLRDAMPAPAASRQESVPADLAPIRDEVTRAAPKGSTGTADTLSAPPAKPHALRAIPPRPEPSGTLVAAPTAPERPLQSGSVEGGSPPATDLAHQSRPLPAQTVPAPAPEPLRKVPSDLPAVGQSIDSAARRESAAPAAAFGSAFRQGIGRLKSESSVVRNPDQWVEQIRRFLLQGRSEEARKSLEELRKRYPDFVVPEDLVALVDPDGSQ